MTEKYRIAVQGSCFEVNQSGGEMVGVYKTEREARRMIESYEEDDSVLETASNLIATAVEQLMRTRKLDRRTAQNWIREAAG
jgi:23S rRNA G2069 N7-methylase RlmK/C1962 C5-methylase RlmI